MLDEYLLNEAVQYGVNVLGAAQTAIIDRY